jgi:arsenite methyltransferase
MTTTTTTVPTPTAEKPCCGPACCGGEHAATASDAPAAAVEATTDSADARERRIQEAVRRRYAAAAEAAAAGGQPGCNCGCGEEATTVFGRALYGDADTSAAPERALRASLGCANPTALADLAPGQVVLDLGSGGGIDVFLAARQVGPAGKVYGLDMTDEMLALARANQAEAGVANAEFVKGRMEEVPLPAASVDVVMSNCVINLSADKDRVLSEAIRVLRPGGRFAVADVVALRPVPDALAGQLELWSECLGGALAVDDYKDKLTTAGFADVDIEVLHTHAPGEAGPEADRLLAELGLTAADVEGLFASAAVRAKKPGDAAAGHTIATPRP